MYKVDWLKTSICLIAAVVIYLSLWWALQHVVKLVQPENASIFASVIAGVIAGTVAIAQMLLTHAIIKRNDIECIKIFRTAFDRPAFRDSFANESSKEHVFAAICDTTRALNTGVLLDRITGNVLRSADEGRGTLKTFYNELEDVAGSLEAIKSFYISGKKTKQFREFKHESHFWKPSVNKAFADKIDDMKIDAIKKMNTVLRKAGLIELNTELIRDENRPR